MPSVCAYIHQFRHRPPCRAPTLLYCSYFHNSTCLWIQHIKGRYFIRRTNLVAYCRLRDFLVGHIKTTSGNINHIKMFVNYNNVRILPWTMSVFGGALFRKRSASTPPNGAAPHNTWQSDYRYFGSTPGCEARNITSGGAAYSTVACRKPDRGKGKSTVRSVTYHDGTEGSRYNSTGQCSINNAQGVYTNGSIGYSASIFRVEMVEVKVQFDLCCSHIFCPFLLLAKAEFFLPSLSRRSEWPHYLPCVRVQK
jgi:hypothetical protein